MTLTSAVYKLLNTKTMILGLPEHFNVEVDSDSSCEYDAPFSPRVIEIDSIEYDELNKSFHKDIDYLTSKVQNIIINQTNEVQQIIHKEKERIRLQEEKERREREEEERKKKEAEELKRKQLEEQRKKEEQEKKIKEAKEKEQKEQEAKDKAIKDKALAEEKLKQQQEQEKKDQEEKAEKDRLEQQKKLDELEANKSKILEAQFLEYKEQIQHFKTDIVEKVNSDKAFKKAVGPIRRSINPKFGQLSNSKRQLNDITNAIVQSINEVKPNDLAFNFILNFIAKAIVSQAEAEVVVQPHAAVSLGMLAANILNVFPELHKYLMARLVKKCPLIIGYTCSIDTEEGRMRMGWKRNKSTQKWEEPDKYDERLAGICSLFAVLTRLGSQQFPISMSWTFLAKMGNLEPDLISNVHFFCIANWWEACGRYFIQTYKFQAVKLMKVLAFDLTNDKKFPAATRLKILGEEGIHENINTLKDMDL